MRRPPRFMMAMCAAFFATMILLTVLTYRKVSRIERSLASRTEGARTSD